MKYQPLLILACLIVAGCDDPGARQSFAQCQLDPRAKHSDGNWDDSFLSTCMQSKGYVTDGELKGSSGADCEDYAFQAEEVGCYRRDTDFDKWIAGRKQNSN